MSVDYGTAISCTDDLHVGKTVSGPTAVAQALYRRYITRRGSLIDDRSYGFRLLDYLHEDVSEQELATIPGKAKAGKRPADRVVTRPPGFDYPPADDEEQEATTIGGRLGSGGGRVAAEWCFGEGLRKAAGAEVLDAQLVGLEAAA